MTALGASLLDKVQRYPVLFFGAAAAWVKLWCHVETGDGVDIALTATVLWLQSAFSLSKKTADEQVEGAKYVGAVEHQAVAQAGQALTAAGHVGAADPPKGGRGAR